MDIYKKTIVNVLDLLFDHLNETNQIMENLIAFEIKIAEIMSKLK